MGLIKDLINSILSQPPRNQLGTSNITSILPIAAVQIIQSGKLPHLNTKTIFLTNGEVCHYIERAIMVTERNIVTGYTGGSNGWSIRIMRGINYRFGHRKGTPIRENVQTYTKGVLYFTNKRAIFVARKNSFEKKISTITAVTPYNDAIILQFGNTSYSILLPDGNIAYTVLNLLKP